MSFLCCSAVTLLLPCWTSNCFFSQNALASGFSFKFAPKTGCLPTPAYLNLAMSREADGGDMEENSLTCGSCSSLMVSDKFVEMRLGFVEEVRTRVGDTGHIVSDSADD